MPVELNKEQITDLLHGISIPPQPQIMVDLQMEQLDPHCSIERITQLISQDVGLAGSILKSVNSRFFGLTHKITSINQAIDFLGIEGVINIVNELSIRGELTDEAIVSLGLFWDGAMDIASACAAIAKHINHRAPDEAYTFGLFHNCGIPLLMQRYEDYSQLMEECYAEKEKRVIDKENKVLDTNHAVVGYYVAKSWNLPKAMCEGIAEHHTADQIFANSEYADVEKKNFIAILKMAEHICGNYRLLGNQTEDFEWQRLESNLLEHVGLSSYDFQNIAESINDLGLNSN